MSDVCVVTGGGSGMGLSAALQPSWHPAPQASVEE